MTSGLFGGRSGVFSSLGRQASTFVACSMALLGASGSAATVSFSDSRPSDFTNWSDTFQLQKFDPTLGALIAVHLTLGGTNQTQTQVENLSGLANLLVSGSDVELALADTTGVLLTLTNSVRVTNALPRFDNLDDFGGTSGRINPIATGESSTSRSFLVGVDDVSRFVGLGSFSVDVAAVGAGFYSGPAAAHYEVITRAGAEVIVTYEYTPPTDDFLGSIGDRVWHDDDQDGIQDDGEAGLEGWTVTLYNEAGDQVGQMPTGPDGLYLFTDLAAGQYRVTVTPQADWVQTFDLDGLSSAHTALATLAAGEDRRDVDFGYDRIPVVLGSIGDRVWKDLDADGVQDAGEPGLVGWSVTLLQDGVVLGSQSTGTDGLYLFENLPAGTYSVQVTRKSGYTQTFDLDGLLTPNIATASLGAGEHRRDVDFGYICFTSTPPSGCGCTPGFWSNRGLGLVRPTDLAVLTALKLVDANGVDADFVDLTTFNFGGSGPANWAAARTRFAAWLGSQNAVNMAAQLSRHLAAFQLNLRYGFVSSTRTFTFKGQSLTGAQVVELANSELLKDQYTPSGDSNRAIQEALKNLLASANEGACR